MSMQTVFLAKLIGLFLVVFSLAMFATGTAMVATVTTLIHEPVFLMTYGMILLAVGLAIVLSHNRWSGGALPVVVSLIGWLVLLRAAILLFLPAATIAALFPMVHFGDFYYAYAAVILAIGLYLAVAGFRASPRAAAS